MCMLSCGVTNRPCMCLDPDLVHYIMSFFALFVHHFSSYDFVNMSPREYNIPVQLVGMHAPSSNCIGLLMCVWRGTDKHLFFLCYNA